MSARRAEGSGGRSGCTGHARRAGLRGHQPGRRPHRQVDPPGDRPAGRLRRVPQPHHGTRLGPARARCSRRRRDPAAIGPPPLAGLLRPAHRLPAGRRGVTRAGGVRRLRPERHRRRGLAPAGGAPPVRHRLLAAPAQPVRAGQPGNPGGRRAGADGLRPADRRQLGQHAVQREPLGPPAGGGRPAAQSQQRREDAGLSELLARRTRRAHRQGGRRPASRRARVHGRAGLRRLRGLNRLLRPQQPTGPVGGVPALPGAARPRRAHIRAGGPPRPYLPGQRQPRRAGAGQRGRQRRLAEHRGGLLQAGHGTQPWRGRPQQAAERGHRLLRPPRPAAPVHRPGGAQAALPRRAPGRCPRLQLRRQGPAGGLRLRGYLLRLGPRAAHALHRARHGVRGRAGRRDLGGQHRRPAVQVARGGAQARDGPGRAGGGLRAPPRAQPHVEHPGRERLAVHGPLLVGEQHLQRRQGQLRHPRREPRLRPRPARLPAAPQRRRLCPAAVEVPARGGLRGRPHAREQAAALRPGGQAARAAGRGGRSTPRRWPTGPSSTG